MRTAHVPVAGRRRPSVPAVAVWLYAAAYLGGCGPGGGPRMPPPEAMVALTSLGEARGFATEEGVVAFLGMPYAQPPVGVLRFAPPVALDTWGGPIEADAFGVACPQSAIESTETVVFDASGSRTTSALAYDPEGSTRAFWDGRVFDGMDPPFLPADLTTLVP